MTAGIRNTLLGCIAFVIAVLTLFVLNVTRERGLSSEQLSSLGFVELPRPRDIAPFSLQDVNAAPVNNEALKGHWTLVFFGFTNCPDVCPTTLRDLAKIKPKIAAAMQAKGVKATVEVWFISVDPERDNPTKLKDYLNFFDPTFRAATGPHEALAEFATQLNAAFAKVPRGGASTDPYDYTMDHTANVVVINPHGHYHGFFRAPLKVDDMPAAMAGLAVGI